MLIPGSLTATLRTELVQHLVPQEPFPVSLLLFDQFEDRLVALDLPAAALSGDAGVKLQLGLVPPSVCSASGTCERTCERSRVKIRTLETN